MVMQHIICIGSSTALYVYNISNPKKLCLISQPVPIRKKNDALESLLALPYQLLLCFHLHAEHGQLLLSSTTMLVSMAFTPPIQDTCNG